LPIGTFGAWFDFLLSLFVEPIDIWLGKDEHRRRAVDAAPLQLDGDLAGRGVDDLPIDP
jgi:hypothetical protein